MPILLERTKTIIRQVVHTIERNMEFLRDKIGGFLGTYPVYKGLVYTEEEEKLLEQTEEVVLDYFPQSPGESLVTEDYESRCEAIEDFALQLIEIYGFDDVEVVITDSSEKFPDGDGIFVYGYANLAERCVYINAGCLKSDDVMVLNHIASTIIHELRHMLQYRVATMEKTYGIPYERRYAWRVNMVNYIEAEYDLEGYITQPIEFDARNFTNRVWQRIYGTNVK